MRSPLSFRGDIGRFAYLALSVGAFFLQHVFAYAVWRFHGMNLHPPGWFWVHPMRALGDSIRYRPDWLVLLGLLLMLLVMWALVALAYRRMRMLDVDTTWILLAATPVLQLVLIAGLAISPEPESGYSPGTTGQGSRVRAMALGVLTGAALCLAAVAFSTLVLGIYGYGLFVVSPFVIGITVAATVNCDSDVGFGKTMSLVMGALALGALSLMAFALEGAICIILASPLIAFVGFIGGAIGCEIADARRGRRAVMKSIAILPFVLVAEVLLPPQADFESVESTVIGASPQAVWESIVHMSPIPDAPAAPFKWGLAYPLRGEINGAGVGAVRRGVFSTGVAYERVVAWVPGQKLDFIVLSDPPSMRELSPYKHVNAPHTQSYFRTRDARFTITPLADGRTRLTLATHHDLDLEPALYFLPMAQWAVHANKVRVLRHFRHQAEASTMQP